MPSGAKVVLLVVVEAFGSSIHTLAWQPWEHMKQLWQWMHPGQHHHFLHHEAAPWTKAHVAGREALGEEFEMRGQSQLRRTVPKVDLSNFSLELFENEYHHKQPLVLTGLVPKWPATREWTWEQLTDPKGKYGRFQLDKHLTFYFSTHAQNENLFLENIILQPPFAHDCPLQSVSQQGDGPKQILGRNFLPRLNKAWFEAKEEAIQEGLLEGDFAESVQGFVIAGPAGAGGMLHIDPDWTSYWNALVHGRKRWMFLTHEELTSLANLVISKGLTQDWDVPSFRGCQSDVASQIRCSSNASRCQEVAEEATCNYLVWEASATFAECQGGLCPAGSRGGGWGIGLRTS